MSASTGAPAFFARSLGSHDLMKGTIAASAPTPPTTAVVAGQESAAPVIHTATIYDVIRHLNSACNF